MKRTAGTARPILAFYTGLVSCLLTLVLTSPVAANPIAGPSYRSAPQNLVIPPHEAVTLFFAVIGIILVGIVGWRRRLAWAVGITVAVAGSVLSAAYEPPLAWIEAASVACVAVTMTAVVVYHGRILHSPLEETQGMAMLLLGLVTLLVTFSLHTCVPSTRLRVSATLCLSAVEHQGHLLVGEAGEGKKPYPRSLPAYSHSPFSRRTCLPTTLPASLRERYARRFGLTFGDYGYICSADASAFTIFCNSANHVREGVPAGYPQYSSVQGEVFGVAESQVNRWGGSGDH